MKLKNLIIGKHDDIYAGVKYAEIKKKNDKDLEDINRVLKEFHYYKYCDKEKDEECEHCHCIYSALWLGKEFKIICNRRDK